MTRALRSKSRAAAASKLRDRRPARARHTGKAQGQAARHIPDGYPRSAALRLAQEERGLQRDHGPLHGQHARGGRSLKAGAIDFICTIEPYASALLNDVKGSVMLSSGVDIYGPHYTDCVLAARTSVIEQHPEDLKALIKAMLKAQLLFEQQREQILAELVGAYYKTSLENARIGAQRQPPCVDQRAQTDFILGRVDSIIEMGYIKNEPGRDAIDWTLLEAAIKEMPEVYSQLQFKSA